MLVLSGVYFICWNHSQSDSCKAVSLVWCKPVVFLCVVFPPPKFSASGFLVFHVHMWFSMVFIFDFSYYLILGTFKPSDLFRQNLIGLMHEISPNLWKLVSGYKRISWVLQIDQYHGFESVKAPAVSPKRFGTGCLRGRVRRWSKSRGITRGRVV